MVSIRSQLDIVVTWPEAMMITILTPWSHDLKSHVLNMINSIQWGSSYLLMASDDSESLSSPSWAEFVRRAVEWREIMGDVPVPDRSRRLVDNRLINEELCLIFPSRSLKETSKWIFCITTHHMNLYWNEEFMYRFISSMI